MIQIKPHLATDVCWEKLKFPVYATRKIDGVRMLNVGGKAVGRSLKPHANKYVTTLFSLPELEGLDGEVTFGHTTSDSLCRDTTGALNRIEGSPVVFWHIFDYIHPEWVDKPYTDRLMAAAKVVEKFPEMNIAVLDDYLISNLEEAQAFYQESLDLGYEGAIFRNNNPHKSGRCTVNEGSYLRAKPSSDKEAVVISLVEAMENQNEVKVNALGRTERSSHKENKVGKGMIGMLQCRDVATGMLIDVGAGKMTHSEREYFWNNPQEIVGKFVKYRSLDTGIKSAPRFARYICMRAEADMSE